MSPALFEFPLREYLIYNRRAPGPTIPGIDKIRSGGTDRVRTPWPLARLSSPGPPAARRKVGDRPGPTGRGHPELRGEGPNFTPHVPAEFYAEGVGWVPADLSFRRFGEDAGDFL